MSKTIKLEIVATGHKLNQDDSLFIVIAPQYANYIDDIHFALEQLTGHSRHAVLPVPKDDIKIFSIQHPITIGVPIPIPTKEKEK